MNHFIESMPFRTQEGILLLLRDCGMSHYTLPSGETVFLITPIPQNPNIPQRTQTFTNQSISSLMANNRMVPVVTQQQRRPDDNDTTTDTVPDTDSGSDPNSDGSDKDNSSQNNIVPDSDNNQNNQDNDNDENNKYSDISESNERDNDKENEKENDKQGDVNEQVTIDQVDKQTEIQNQDNITNQQSDTISVQDRDPEKILEDFVSACRTPLVNPDEPNSKDPVLANKPETPQGQQRQQGQQTETDNRTPPPPILDVGYPSADMNEFTFMVDAQDPPLFAGNDRNTQDRNDNQNTNTEESDSAPHIIQSPPPPPPPPSTTFLNLQTDPRMREYYYQQVMINRYYTMNPIERNLFDNWAINRMLSYDDLAWRAIVRARTTESVYLPQAYFRPNIPRVPIPTRLATPFNTNFNTATAFTPVRRPVSAAQGRVPTPSSPVPSTSHNLETHDIDNNIENRTTPDKEADTDKYSDKQSESDQGNDSENENNENSEKESETENTQKYLQNSNSASVAASSTRAPPITITTPTFNDDSHTPPETTESEGYSPSDLDTPTDEEYLEARITRAKKRRIRSKTEKSEKSKSRKKRRK